MRNFIKIEKETGKILTTYVDKVHGTYIPEVYQEVEKGITLSNENTQTVKVKQLVREAYFDISNLDLTDCIEVDEETYRTILDNGFNNYDIETETWSKKDFRTVEEILEQAKQVAINKVNNDVKTLIIAGFHSDVLGIEHKYQSEEIDQLNLLDKVAAGVNQKIKCSADDGKTWELKMHTIEQLKNVLKDGSLYKNQLLESGEALKNKVRACKTLKELELVKI